MWKFCKLVFLPSNHIYYLLNILILNMYVLYMFVHNIFFVIILTARLLCGFAIGFWQYGSRVRSPHGSNIYMCYRYLFKICCKSKKIYLDTTSWLFATIKVYYILTYTHFVRTLITKYIVCGTVISLSQKLFRYEEIDSVCWHFPSNPLALDRLIASEEFLLSLPLFMYFAMSYRLLWGVEKLGLCLHALMLMGDIDIEREKDIPYCYGDT